MSDSQENVRSDVDNPLMGAWDFVSYQFVLEDTILVRTTDFVTGRKIYSESSFAFVSPVPDKGEVRFAGYGSYTINGSKYTEHTFFHSSTRFNDTSSEFDFEVIGDTLKVSAYLPVGESLKPYAGEATEVLFEEIRVRVE